ncbi:MAG TPA: cupin domain-containing protein [Acidimicrobiales bacterium]|nr:cupin domain-containing protein [Acidimicrobiales bacterium]
MSSIEAKSFAQADETRSPAKTRIDVVNVGGAEVGRITFQPGWRWSECIRPIAGTEYCQNDHVGVLQSGRLSVTHQDGTEVEIGAGDAYRITPGHDAWVVGDEPVVAYEFKSAGTYAKA